MNIITYQVNTYDISNKNYLHKSNRTLTRIIYIYMRERDFYNNN